MLKKNHGSSSVARGFSFDELTRHALILGKPGQGKTNLLLSLILELGDPALQAKRPSAQIFIDPHGDASFKLARTMKDWSKLLLLDPTEIQLSINPLELLPYEGEDERIFQIQVTVSELLMILEDILKTDLERASRMSWIFTGGLYFL
ncbi:MAG: helicase HerA domain-containing protein, partial [Nitrososphaerales archaeon]